MKIFKYLFSIILNIIIDFINCRASRESYGDKAIGYVQLSRKNNICTIKGRVCPEHRVRSKAYLVTLTINEKSRKIQDIQCHDCAASAGNLYSY